MEPMMCMKTNALSSNRRSNTEVEACGQERSGCVPTTASSSGGGLGERISGVAPLLVGGTRSNPTCHNSGQKDPRGSLAPQEMLKMKEPPGMCMKTKDRMTICPTQKMTFLPGCTPFYRELQVFCTDRELFCRNSSAG
jgi:hypothetical protein